jgi:hypothetical protein
VIHYRQNPLKSTTSYKFTGNANHTNRINYSINPVREIRCITNILISQDSSYFDEIYCTQYEGLTMGAPSSAILPEIFPQYLEHSGIYQMLLKHRINGYLRCIGNLIIRKERRAEINHTQNAFNNVTSNLKFTIEKEKKNKINFLHFAINE